MTEHIRIEGLKSTVRQLKKLDPALAKEIKVINKAAAEMVAAAARPRVHSRTGKLAGTIRAGATQYAGTVRMGGPASVPYAVVNHFGWPAHHYVPNKVLYAALDTETPAVIGLYDKDVAALVERAFHPEAD